MAKKVFLQDENKIEILPITRGELILDSSGNPALHSTEFLATSSKPGLMSIEDKKKLANLNKVTIDSTLSTTSENPVQNKVITQAINNNTKLANNAQSTANKAKEEISKSQQLINSIKASYLKSASVSGNTLTIKDQSNTEINFYNTTYGVVSQTTNGLAPSIGTVASATIGTQADEWVLTSTKGSAPTWRKLPVNAFKNDDNNTTYTFTSGNGGFTVTPSGGTAQTVSIGKPATAGTADNANSLNNSGLLDTQEKIDNFLTANKFQYAIFKTAEANNLDFASNDGMILSIPWNKVSYGAQLAFDDLKLGLVKVRGKQNNWGNWYTLLHSGNYNSYVPTLNGIGASGTWDINITGNAVTSNATTWINKTDGFRTSNGLGYTQKSDGPLNDTNTTGAPTSYAHYIMMSHGNGQTYYHYQLAFPFWGSPLYQRKTGGSSTTENQSVWYSFITSENISSQSVNYATSAGSVAWGNITNKPDSFIPSAHNHTTEQITSLSNYKKATSASDLVTSDTLNSALGKLEYTSRYAYNWVIGVTAADTDEYINKWNEIVEFLDSVKEGTDILDEFVTRKTDQVIIGKKIFNTNTNTSPLVISRNRFTEEAVSIGVNDTQAIFEYVNNEKSNAFVFKLINNDTEASDGSGANTNTVTFTGNSLGSTVAATTFQGRLAYTYLTGSGTTKDQVIVSNGVTNGWTLKTLGSRAFDSTSYLPLNGGTMNSNARISSTSSLYFGNSNNTGWLYFMDMASQSGSSYWQIKQYGDASFKGTISAATFNGSLNGNANTATNSDLLDGYHYNSFLRKVIVPNNTENDFNTFESMTLTGRGDPTTGASLVNAPWTGSGPAGGYGVLTYSWPKYSLYGIQIAAGYGDRHLFIRNCIWNSDAGNSVWESNWSKVALTTDNVASATKLQTARTIWGQLFDGTANVSGALTGVTNITASGNVTIGGTLGVTGVTTLSSTLNVNGQLYLTGLVEGTSTITDNTEILTSYASNNGFADTNTVGRVYRRDAIYLYNYVKGKLDSVYSPLNHTHPYLLLSGGTMTGQIQRVGVSSSWISGRNNAFLRTTTISGYSPFASIKTTNGSWEIGVYNASYYYDDLIFSYCTDENFNSNNNMTSSQIIFCENGTIDASGFRKSGSSDSYVLLGAGGHKAISDFLLKSEVANQELSNNLTTITKTLTVTADWMDTGIKYTDLATGTYIVQVSVYDSADNIWDGYWSGVMSWYDSTTNAIQSDEILLHRAGHALGANIYLRTIVSLREDGRNLRLQIAANKTLSTAATYTFKFKRVI